MEDRTDTGETPEQLLAFDIDLLVQAEHVRVVFKHALIIFLANLSASVTLVVGLREVVPVVRLDTWLGVMLTLNLLRFIQSKRFNSSTLDAQQTLTWEKKYLTAVLVSGLMWGTAGGLFYVSEPPVYSMFLSLVLVGMASAATASLSFQRIAYPLFLIPTISPLVVRLLLDQGTIQNLLGYIIPFYFTLLFILSRQIFHFVNLSLTAEVKNGRLARVDHLTSVANRRAFDERLQAEWSRGARAKESLSLIIADIDDFKSYNDTYGHAAGDQVLRFIARAFVANLRRGSDTVARIGGEEFGVILPNTDLDGAIFIAESIRAAVNKRATHIGRKHTLAWPTVSLGVSSCLPHHRMEVSTLFQNADEALYKAKEQGKNRVASRVIQT